MGLADLDPMQYFDFLEVVDPADYEMVGISLQVEEDLELLLKLILKCIDAVYFELLVQYLFHKGIVCEYLLQVLPRSRCEIEDHDECWVLFLPRPLEHFTEVACCVLEVEPPIDAAFQILPERIVLVASEELGD